MSLAVRDIVAALRRRLEAIYGSRLAGLVLFGSQARGDVEAGSDIDVLVVLKGEVQPGIEIARTGGVASELSLRYDAVISCLFMSEERYRVEKSPLLLNIRREGIAA